MTPTQEKWKTHKTERKKANQKKMELTLPLVMLCFSLSFSQDAKEALRASVIFLVVPGVRGGTGAGRSGGERRTD